MKSYHPQSRSVRTGLHLAPAASSPRVARLMRAIPVRNTMPERRVAQILRRQQLSFRRNTPHLPGTPDFYLPWASLAIFVDGCFWHGCPRCFRTPSVNSKWWVTKIETTKRRDRRKDAALRRLGLSVIHIREHDSEDRIERRIRRLTRSTTRRASPKRSRSIRN